ncbi:hypothetical protein IFM89_032758 [Coptis chinensis]|uniref:DUF6821 domain-containing protein n=1 Tax=Coptis chinensis TaxID=261450 RepID=A0A835HGE1_9MAGN|nr:hypothetical protein IFM89_032758 [Coptis chinensis]
MDLDDWEYLPDAGYLDFNHHEHSGKGQFSTEKVFDPKGVIRPFPTSPHIHKAPLENPRVLSPVLISLELTVKSNKGQELELNEVPFIDIGVIPPVNKVMNLGTVGADQDTVSRVFFKKMKENEFVDMKMDSPKSSSKGLKLLTDAGSVHFEDKEEAHKTSSEVVKNQEMVSKELYTDSNIKKGKNWEGTLNIWGWKVSGVGALCCIGVVAATTICVFIFGNRRGTKQHHSQKIQFQIHSDDKKIKQVFHQQPLLSRAISAAKDVPLNEAHIFLGGF